MGQDTYIGSDYLRKSNRKCNILGVVYSDVGLSQYCTDNG